MTEHDPASTLDLFALGLLGPAEYGGDRKSDQVSHDELDSLSRVQRYEFRRMWAHYELSVEAVRDGKVARGAVLRHIDEHAESTNGTGPVETRRGDFREVLADLEDESVALVLTDPPYPAEFLPLWSDMAELAARVLIPGGSLLAYSGQGNLPNVIHRLSEHLRYWWTLSLQHGHGSATGWPLPLSIRAARRKGVGTAPSPLPPFPCRGLSSGHRVWSGSPIFPGPVWEL